MATIEPRLIHLLNDASIDSNYLPPLQYDLDLPPLQSPKIASEAVSLPPLDVDSSNQQEQLLSLQYVTGQLGQIEGVQARDDSAAPAVSAASKPKTVGHSIRSLLDDVEEQPTNTVSFAHFLDEILDVPEESPSRKKRPRSIAPKEDFVQLPQPMKRQKSNQSMMPPIINGLHEPPPNAALFPRIDPSAVVKRRITIRPEADVAAQETGSTAQHGQPVEDKRKIAKPRRKWTERETSQLLLGVDRHGVGKWTTILEDRDFVFDGRSAVDLKDRFRTCCPAELRDGTAPAKQPERGSNTVKAAPGTTSPASQPTRRRKNFVNAGAALTAPQEAPTKEADEVPAGRKVKSSRAHRKNINDLQHLGIHEPFKQSQRRSRHAFSEQEDQDILQGLETFGPAWSKIQRHTSYHLSNRKPTDLRDRVRNKYPDIFAKLDKPGATAKPVSRTSDVLEPSVNTVIENSLTASARNVSAENLLLRLSSIQDLPRLTFQGGVLDFTEPLSHV